MRWTTLGLALLAFAYPANGQVAGPAPAKKLIEFGWDEPDTAFLRRHLAEMERTPFDGCVFHASVAGADGKASNFAWLAWGRRAFTERELAPAVDDLKSLPRSRFSRHFLRFNVTPGDVDWFDDFAPILENARLAARLAREGGCAGILFDVEQYQAHLFEYAKQRDAATKPWLEYAGQAKARGRELARAFRRGSPDLTVLLTFGHSYPWKQSDGGKKPLADCEDGLLAPFLDGLIEGATPGLKLVDAHELSYGYRDLDKFDRARRTIREDVLPIVARPEAYGRVVSVGFGLWLDYDWPKHGWDADDPSKNYFTPAGFEASLRKAIEASDEYVWIYTEKPRWWTDAGPPAMLPGAYAEGIRRAMGAKSPSR